MGTGDLIETVEPLGWRAHPSLLARPHYLLLRTSLALALSGGFGLGLYLVLGLAFEFPLPPMTPALMQVHGQVQAMGFIALFIMAVGVQLFPRFHGSTLDRPELVSFGGLLLAGGIVLRAASQPATPAAWRSVALVAAGGLELAGVLLAVYAFSRVIKRGGENRRPRGARLLLPATLGLSLLMALLLNLAISVQLAVGPSIAPFRQNEALLHLQLWGFAGTMVLVVAGRLYPQFLMLQPTRDRLFAPALALWAAGSLGVPLAWLLAADLPLARPLMAAGQLAGAALYAYALRLYEPPAHASPMPHITGPTRRWVRVAFGFLLVAAALQVGVAAADAFGRSGGLTALSAARHALAQGFLMPVIVLMGARLLPGYASAMVRRPRLLAGLLWTLFAGAALRSSAELLGGYGPIAGPLAALGGALGAAAFTVFAVGVWRAGGAARVRF